MSKFLCRCTHVIDFINSPVSDEFTLVPNKVLYDLAERADKGKINYEEFFECIDSVGQDVISCAVCGRIWIKSNGGEEYFSYVAERE